MSVKFFANLADFINFGDIPTARFSRDLAWTVLSFFKVGTSTSDERTIIGKDVASIRFLIRVENNARPSDIEAFLGGTACNASLNNVVESNVDYLTGASCDGGGATATLTVKLFNMASVKVGEASDTNPGTGGVDTDAVFIGQRDSQDAMDGPQQWVGYFDHVFTDSDYLGYLDNPIAMGRKYKHQYLIYLGGQFGMAKIWSGAAKGVVPVVIDPGDRLQRSEDPPIKGLSQWRVG